MYNIISYILGLDNEDAEDDDSPVLLSDITMEVDNLDMCDSVFLQNDELQLYALGNSSVPTPPPGPSTGRSVFPPHRQHNMHEGQNLQTYF